MKIVLVLLFALLYLCTSEIQSIKNYQECRTPGGIFGHCIPYQYCSSSRLKQNILEILNYLCVIDQFSIGVCCPDNLGITKISSPQQVDETFPMPAHNSIIGRESNNHLKNIRSEERGCGISTKTFKRGTADPNEWPWMAALVRRSSISIFCGGVLITDRHVLTAAHCTYKYSKNEIFVRLGEYNFEKKNETRARDMSIVEIVQHIDFDENTYDHDIAILKLFQPILFNTYIWPVCMPPTGETFEGYEGIVTGWGSKFFGGPGSDILMEVSVPIWSSKSCQKVFVERIGAEQLCAGAEEGGRDSCQGDSGGPLLVQFPNKRWTTVGIVSYGVRCGEKNRPGVYTRVNSYSSWIIENAVF